MKMTNKKISAYRKNLRQLLDEIEQLAYKAAYADPLVRGSPGEVFRCCGKKGCRCASDLTKRHGPYRVIQIYVDGRQKQIALRKNEQAIWEQAQHYQKQMEYLVKLKDEMRQLEELVKEIIEGRIKQEVLLCRKK